MANNTDGEVVIMLAFHYRVSKRHGFDSRSVYHFAFVLLFCSSMLRPLGPDVQQNQAAAGSASLRPWEDTPDLRNPTFESDESDESDAFPRSPEAERSSPATYSLFACVVLDSRRVSEPPEALRSVVRPPELTSVFNLQRTSVAGRLAGPSNCPPGIAARQPIPNDDIY